MFSFNERKKLIAQKIGENKIVNRWLMKIYDKYDKMDKKYDSFSGWPSVTSPVVTPPSPISSITITYVSGIFNLIRYNI